MGMKEATLETKIGKAEDPVRVTDQTGRIPGECKKTQKVGALTLEGRGVPCNRVLQSCDERMLAWLAGWMVVHSRMYWMLP